MSEINGNQPRRGPEGHRRGFIPIAGSDNVGARLIGGLVQPEPAAESPGAAPTIRSRAIVIGLNESQNAKTLENPVRDACRLAEWLVRKAGVNVADIALLTSPGQIPADTPHIDGLDPLLASRSNLLRTIRQFPNRAR